MPTVTVLGAKKSKAIGKSTPQRVYGNFGDKSPKELTESNPDDPKNKKKRPNGMTVGL